MDTHIYNKYNSFTFDDVADNLIVNDGAMFDKYIRRSDLTEADFASKAACSKPRP